MLFGIEERPKFKVIKKNLNLDGWFILFPFTFNKSLSIFSYYFKF